MHWLSWVFIGTFFGISYRLSYKLISGHFTPLFNVAFISLFVSLICFTLFFLRDYQKIDVASISLKSLAILALIGVIVAGLEISIMMIYKSGGPISVAQSLASVLIGLSCFAIGLLWFKETLNMGQIIGFFVSILGAGILTYYSR